MPSRPHVFVVVFVFKVWKCNEKIRKNPVILLAPLKATMPQNHQKHNFLTFLHPDKLRCPKDHMTESKYSKRSPLLSTNLVQIVM